MCVASLFTIFLSYYLIILETCTPVTVTQCRYMMSAIGENVFTFLVIDKAEIVYTISAFLFAPMAHNKTPETYTGSRVFDVKMFRFFIIVSLSLQRHVDKPR